MCAGARRSEGTLVVSEPLDDGRDDWEAVPPQSFVTLGPDGLSIEPFRLPRAEVCRLHMSQLRRVAAGSRAVYSGASE